MTTANWITLGAVAFNFLVMLIGAGMIKPQLRRIDKMEDRIEALTTTLQTGYLSKPEFDVQVGRILNELNVIKDHILTHRRKDD